jgi:hypothetical protein
MFKEDGNIKNEALWLRQLNEALTSRTKSIVTLANTGWFVLTIDILSKAKAFFESWEVEIEKANSDWEEFNSQKDEVLNFNWPSDEVFTTWVSKYGVVTPVA